MDRVLVIVGPTGSGKSALAVAIAKKYNGEIISGDSVQVYRELNIGSGKITTAEQQGIKHHLLDILDYKENYSVYDFQKKAREIISDISSRGKLPIVAGGTGLYIKALLYDYDFADNQSPKTDYQELTNDELYAILEKQDAQAAAKLHVNNRKRLLRSLELLETLPGNKTEYLAQQKHEMIYSSLIIGLTMERTKLYQKINERVDKMFEQGLVAEVSALVKGKLENFDYQAMSAIGYKEFKDYYLKQANLEEVKEKIKTRTRQFAKRQYTWFNNQMPITWFNVEDNTYRDTMDKFIEDWLS